jgi:dihydrofolate reductase
MGILGYGMITSLDGYVADAHGEFGWAEPDEEVHRFVNARERAVGTYLYGRRMFEMMRFWADDANIAGGPDYVHEYAAVWRAARKVVFSTTLATTRTDRTRLERRFDVAAVRQLKESGDGRLSVSGPGLAAHALRSGLVDELELYVAPVVVGAGTPMLPAALALDLSLLDEHRFASGMVFLRYAVEAVRSANTEEVP